VIESKWVSLSDAARLLRKSYHATLRLVLIGSLDARREDGRWRVNRLSVQRWLRQARGEVAAVVEHEPAGNVRRAPSRLED